MIVDDEEEFIWHVCWVTVCQCILSNVYLEKVHISSHVLAVKHAHGCSSVTDVNEWINSGEREHDVRTESTDLRFCWVEPLSSTNLSICFHLCLLPLSSSLCFCTIKTQLSNSVIPHYNINMKQPCTIRRWVCLLNGFNRSLSLCHGFYFQCLWVKLLSSLSLWEAESISH